MMLLVFFPVIPATLYLGSHLSGRSYYFTSTLVILEIMLPFLMSFEHRKPKARELVVVAVLSALAAAARVVIPIPNFKAIFAVIMLSGIGFGPETGFMVGALSAFASNFFYGQGAYTPWQMFAYGAGGMLAGFLFSRDDEAASETDYGEEGEENIPETAALKKKKRKLPRKPIVMGIFGFLTMLFFVGPLLDTCSVFLDLPDPSLSTAWPLYVSGFPVNLMQGISTFLVMFFFGRPLLEKMDRVRLQYGLGEEHGI